MTDETLADQNGHTSEKEELRGHYEQETARTVHVQYAIAWQRKGDRCEPIREGRWQIRVVQGSSVDGSRLSSETVSPILYAVRQSLGCAVVPYPKLLHESKKKEEESLTFPGSLQIELVRIFPTGT
jgi:hypothetical protein